MTLDGRGIVQIAAAKELNAMGFGKLSNVATLQSEYARLGKRKKPSTRNMGSRKTSETTHSRGIGVALCCADFSFFARSITALKSGRERCAVI